MDDLAEFMKTRQDRRIRESPEDFIIEKDSLCSAIMCLNQKDRELILLYYYQELTVQEISDITGKKENAINQQLCRIRKKLRKMLG